MNPLQQAVVRRKIAYFVAILVLFTLSMFWRGEIAVPFKDDSRAAARVASATILDQATRMELRELDEGAPELAGSALRLGLVGSRGLVVTVLWKEVMEVQKRNDFHKLDALVRTVTTLQPHFITPWIFQSWNITYNVSVEMQSLADMYFYIARGIELLAEGERRNRKSPDMRYQVAFYYQNKFGVSDQVQTLRCLLQLSCIPPNKRDPDALLTADKSAVDLKAFQQFCADHPHLVRRLRGEERRDREKKTTFEALQVRTPEDVVEFLRSNQKVPSRYKNASDLAPDDLQFPSLPRQFDEGPDEANPRQVLGDAFTGYLAAKAWFSYANVLVPPNPTDAAGEAVPSGTPGPGEYDPFKFRVPRLPMLIIFRQGPPRAQTFQAELMQKDGWYDAEGWEVDARSDETNAWFVDKAARAKRKVVVGNTAEWSQEAWKKAAEMWEAHGERNGLHLKENRRAELLRAAGVTSEFSPEVFLPPPLPPELAADPDKARKRDAMSALFFYRQNRQVTNFPFYLATSQVEQRPETVAARKALWKADQARRVGNKQEAIRLYEEGLKRWKQVLAKNPAYHRDERSDRIEEETAEFEMEFLRLISQDDPRVRDRARDDYRKGVEAAGKVLPFVAGVSPVIPESIKLDLYAMTAVKFSPFDGIIQASELPSANDPRAGGPWISPDARKALMARQGMLSTDKPSVVPPTGMQPDGAPPGGPPGPGGPPRP